jgi:hypothetical protein
MSSYQITAHAVARYQSRVSAVSPAEAAEAIARLLADARLRPTPRHWMRNGTSYGCGVRFAYSPRAPRIAFVIRGSSVVTVLTRMLYRDRIAGDDYRRVYDRRCSGRRRGRSRHGLRQSRERMPR